MTSEEQDGDMNADAITLTMVDRIVGRFQPARVVLSGSRARGSASEWSDVDLLVVMPHVADKRKAAIDIRRLLADMPVSKGIIVATPEEVERRGQVVGTVIHAALREGTVLYERG